MTVCDWPIDYIECGECAPLEAMAEAQRLSIEAMAATYLWHWTGRTYGLCETEVRPCREVCGDGPRTYRSYPVHTGTPSGATWRPVLISGDWYNIGCGRCGGDRCSCTYVSSIRLPGPVADIIEVNIDGAVVPPESYRVDRDTFLVSEGEPWPTCQDLSAPPGEEGTWTVKYHRGLPVPEGGQVAAGLLACEMAKAACRDTTCALPQRVQSITRQGVTVAVLDSFDDIDSGHTGIWLIDSWMASVMKPPRGAAITSPDVPTWPRVSRTTWHG